MIRGWSRPTTLGLHAPTIPLNPGAEREHLGERVGDHVPRRTIDEMDVLLVDDPADEMKANIDVSGTGMILVVTNEGDGRLVVRAEGH